MTFNDFVHEYKLKNKATANIEICQVLSTLYLNDVGIYLRDDPFDFDVAIVNLHATKATHCFAYVNEKYFDSYRCSPPQKLSKIFIKPNGHCLTSESRKQGLTKKFSLCKLLLIYILFDKSDRY